MSESQRPAFSAPLYAFLRQGTKESAQLLQAFPDSIRIVEEPGTLANPTMQMITEGIQPNSAYDRFLDRYNSQSGSQRGEPEMAMDR